MTDTQPQEGYALVPREPTIDMVEAGGRTDFGAVYGDDLSYDDQPELATQYMAGALATYRAMIAAAPTPSETASVGDGRATLVPLTAEMARAQADMHADLHQRLEQATAEINREDRDWLLWLLDQQKFVARSPEGDVDQAYRARLDRLIAAIQPPPLGEPKPEKTCEVCCRDNPVWFAPNTLWNLVMGGPEAQGDPGGMVCPACFIEKAEAQGIVPTAWELKPEGTPPPSGGVCEASQLEEAERERDALRQAPSLHLKERDRLRTALTAESHAYEDSLAREDEWAAVVDEVKASLSKVTAQLDRLMEGLAKAVKEVEAARTNDAMCFAMDGLLIAARAALSQAAPVGEGLKPQVRDLADTLSMGKVVADHFFPSLPSEGEREKIAEPWRSPETKVELVRYEQANKPPGPPSPPLMADPSNGQLWRFDMAGRLRSAGRITQTELAILSREQESGR